MDAKPYQEIRNICLATIWALDEKAKEYNVSQDEVFDIYLKTFGEFISELKENPTVS